MRLAVLLAALSLPLACAAQSADQQQMPGMNMPAEQPAPMQHVHQPQGTGLIAAHTEFSSGTAWQPLDAPENMRMTTRAGWQLMAHGNLFVSFNHQGGPRGVGKIESMSMFMLMEQRKLGAGTLVLRQMFSADALTAPHGGFPELFQTGETYRGRPLVDRQHPHSVFGELSLLYTRPLAERVSWFAYGGPAAEPALGPVAFVHRESAAEIPAAPLAHHLQDSTHTSYGVVTTGIVLHLHPSKAASAAAEAQRYAAIKLEGSVFNGREPGEHRAAINFGALDSWSLRAGLDLGSRWTTEYSVGHLTHPEALEPGDIVRQTAAVGYTRRFANGHWCSTLIWGRNHKEDERSNQNSYLLESVVNFARLNYGFTRLELVDKNELFPGRPAPEFDPTFPANQPIAPHPSFRVGAFTFGGVRDLVHNQKWQIGVGADVTFYRKPAALDPSYGRNPTSFALFVRIRPGEMKMH